jgi:conjugal transfer pilus assembly protein TraV
MFNISNKFSALIKTAAILFLIGTTTGCASMLSIGKQETEGCKGIPEANSKCMSALEVYQATSNGQSLLKIGGKEESSDDSENESSESESDTQSEDAPKKAKTEHKANNIPFVSTITGNNPVPIRTPSQVMRIWVNQYEDSNGDLVAPGYVYTEIQPRKWLVGETITPEAKSKSPLTSAIKPKENINK